MFISHVRCSSLMESTFLREKNGREGRQRERGGMARHSGDGFGFDSVDVVAGYDDDDDERLRYLAEHFAYEEAEDEELSPIAGSPGNGVSARGVKFRIPVPGAPGFQRERRQEREREERKRRDGSSSRRQGDSPLSFDSNSNKGGGNAGHQFRRYLQPTISSSNKNSEERPSSSSSPPSSQNGQERGTYPREERGERPQSSRRHEAVQNLKHRDRAGGRGGGGGGQNTSRNTRNGYHDNQYQQQSERRREEVAVAAAHQKRVRFPVEEREERVGGRHNRERERERGDKRLWNEVPESSEQLYSSLAADIRALFDRAMEASGDDDNGDAAAGGGASPLPLTLNGASSMDGSGGGGAVMDRTADAYRREHEELQKKSFILQKELQKVEESRMQLELAAGQESLHKQAKERLDVFEGKLSRDLESKIRGFMEEKESKLGEIREFRSSIDSKLQMLRRVLKELETKEEHLETAYAAAIREIHSEYRAALETKAKDLEAEVQAKLRMLVRSMATKGK